MQFSISPSRATKVLGGAICVLAAFSLIGQFSAHFLGHGRLLGFVPQFNLGVEGNISTYFATILLLSAALLLGVIARFAWKQGLPFRRHWLGLALIFLYMSVDEFAMIHESLNQPMETVLEADGILHYPWVVPAMGVVALFAISYARFFWHLETRWKSLFAAAGIIYVTGALGVELLGARYMSQQGEATFTYELIVTVEEMMEMIGVVLFIYALLEYLREHDVWVGFRIEEKKEAVPPA